MREPERAPTQCLPPAQLPSLVAHVFPDLPRKPISLYLVYDHSTVLSDLLKQQATGRQLRPHPFLGWQFLSPQERDEAAHLVVSRHQTREAPPLQAQPPVAALTTGAAGKARAKADGLAQAEAPHGQWTAAAELPAQAAKRQRVEPTTEPHPKLTAETAAPAATEPQFKLATVPSSQGAEVAAEAMPEEASGRKKQKKLLLPQDQPASETALPEAETQDSALKPGKKLLPPGTAAATKSGRPDAAVRPDEAAAKSGRQDAEGRPEVASAKSGRPDSAVRSEAAAAGSAKPPAHPALGPPSKAVASRPGDSGAPAPAVSGEGAAGPVASGATGTAVEGKRSRAVEDPVRAAGPSSHPGDPSSMGPKERECTIVRGL